MQKTKYFKPNIFYVDKKSEQFVMVLEFADSGNLQNYLKKSFSSLTWSNKIKIATEITQGLMCLHTLQIIHCDLVKK